MPYKRLLKSQAGPFLRQLRRKRLVHTTRWTKDGKVCEVEWDEPPSLLRRAKEFLFNTFIR